MYKFQDGAKDNFDKHLWEIKNDNTKLLDVKKREVVLFKDYVANKLEETEWKDFLRERTTGCFKLKPRLVWL